MVDLVRGCDPVTGCGGGEGWVIDLVRGVAGVRGCVGGAGTLHGADTKMEP